MSHPTPAYSTTATPRFAPYARARPTAPPPSALRTAYFTPSTPSSSISLLTTPRSLSLPHRAPRAPPPPPRSDPRASSASGPQRARTRRQNPFDELSATDFDAFVAGVRDRVKDALHPDVARNRLRREREARHAARGTAGLMATADAAAAAQDRPAHDVSPLDTNDVFGQVRNVELGKTNDDDGDDGDSAEAEQVERESSWNHEDPRSGGSSSRSARDEDEDEDEDEAEESLSRERDISEPTPRKEKRVVEIVLLDSDDEGDEQTTAARNDRDRQFEREDSIVESIVVSNEEDYSEQDIDEEDQGEDDDDDDGGERGSDGDEDLQATSSRSPTPNSLASLSPRKPSSFPSRPARFDARSPQIEPPSLPPVSSSPEASHARLRGTGQHVRREQWRDRSPLFRPRTEGSVSELSAPPEDFDLEVDVQDYYSQEEDEERDDDDEAVLGQDGENATALAAAAAATADDVPPVSQRIKRDAFGRPIRYQEAEEDDAEAGEFEGFEEEEGFGEEEADLMDYRVSELSKEDYGYRLEDLVHEGITEDDKDVGEEPPSRDDVAAAMEEEDHGENLGTIELDSSDDEGGNVEIQVAPSAGDITTSSFAVPALDPATLDLLSTVIDSVPTPTLDFQIDNTLESAPFVPDFSPSTVDPTVPVPFEALAELARDSDLPPAAPLAVESVAPPVPRDFATPPEAQEDLLDVDQVRARESERLPFLQDVESGAAFAGYEDDQELVMREGEELRLGGAHAPEDRENEQTQDSGVEPELVCGTVRDQEGAAGVEEQQKDGTPVDSEGDEGEYFGQGVPGDEVVPGREIDSEDDDGSDRRVNHSEEDLEDLGPRIPYEAKGKGRALPSPSVDSDDPSRLALSDGEENYSSASSDAEDTWRPELLLQYDLDELERLMGILSSQLRQTRSERLQLVILQQLDDVQEIYAAKGGELIDVDDNDEDEMDEDQAIDQDASVRNQLEGDQIGSERVGEDEVEVSPPSPDRSAFEPPSPPPDEDTLTASDRCANDQVMAIATQLVDLQSSSNPFPSVRIGAPSALDHPEATLSSHFRREDILQPNLDDPINLPPGPATMTDVDEPVESEQQDGELAIERVVADEQVPIDMPMGQATTLHGEVREQTDQVDRAPSERDEGGMTIVDDDEDPFGAEVVQDNAAKPTPDKLDKQDASAESPVDIAHPSTLSKEGPARDSEQVKVIDDAEQPSTSAVVPAALPVDNLDVPPVTFNPSSTSVVETGGGSPFVPLPPTTTAPTSLASGPDLSRFSSHFRYEPDGPPPALDAPLNLPAPPSVVTDVDEPIIRQQQDAELEPELQVSNEEEDVPEMHKLSEMVDLSRKDNVIEAEDSEKPPSQEESLLIIDDDEPTIASSEEVKEQAQTQPAESPVPHRSRIGVTPPPSNEAADTAIAEGSAPPQNPALTLSTPPRSPSPRPIESGSASGCEQPRQDSNSAADEIRFDDDDQPFDYASLPSPSSSDDAESDAEVANELLSPHKRSGGVLGFSGGAEEFGETIVMNSDSEDDAPSTAGAVDGQSGANGFDSEGVEELDLDEVKAELRRQNADEDELDRRHFSEAPSSEPISYASSDERADADDENELHSFLNDEVPGQTRDSDEHGQSDELSEDLPAPERSMASTSLRIHGVAEPGEWDPSQPIEFGSSADTLALGDDSLAGDSAPLAESGHADSAPDVPIVAVVEMNVDRGDTGADEGQTSPSDVTIIEDVVESVADSLAASMDPRRNLPLIEVEPDVIEEALRPVDASESGFQKELDKQAMIEAKVATTDAAETVATDPQAAIRTPEGSDSGDEIVLASRPAQNTARRSPRRPATTLPDDPISTLGRSPVTSDALSIASPIRRSSRLSSTGPTATAGSSSAQSGKTKRPRKSDENGAAAPDTTSSAKKPRRSGHSTKLRAEVTDDEEPTPAAGSGRGGLRVHHHHQSPEHAPPAPSTPKGRQFEPPLTRSRCHFTRLRIPSSTDERSLPYEFLVPACALTSVIANETMRRHAVENLGPVDESMHCRGVALGGRGFDADAAQVMHDRHPSRLVPDDHVLDVVRRIVGTEIFDEGEVEVLPRPAPAVVGTHEENAIVAEENAVGEREIGEPNRSDPTEKGNEGED